MSDEADAGDQSDDDDDVFNDPDFAHMSDSDLDSKLPLFEGSDSEPDDSDSEEADKEAEKKADKREEREREVQAKADDYMANALNSIRSNVAGKDGKKNPRAQVRHRFNHNKHLIRL